LVILQHLNRAGRSCWTIIVAVGAVGIVIGVMNMTGLGIRFSNVILSFSSENIVFALVLLMLGCLVLGMGMPTVPAYLLIVLVMGPAITKLGVSVLLAHLFAVYYAVFSNITPPVALAAFAAAPIAGSKPMETGLEATRVALTGLIIPYIFIFNPSLSLVENFDAVSFLWALARTCLASWLIAETLSGLTASFRSLALRAAFAGLVICLFVNFAIVTFAATGVTLLILARRFMSAKREASVEVSI
jgi:TRAP-type uncharacterized transport system fused permease subunit